MFDMLTSPYTHPLKRLIWMRLKAGARAVWETITGNPATFTAKAAPLRQLKVAFSPVQSLNGYDAPWPAGGGTNKLNNAKSGTTETIGAYTFKSNSDGSVLCSGTGSTSANFFLNETLTLKAGTYTLFALDAVVTTGTVRLYIYNNSTQAVVAQISLGTANASNTFTLAEDATLWCYINIASTGATFNGKTLYPMIVEGSTASAWTPYSNICPISGWDSLNVEQRGKNLLTATEYSGIHYASGIGTDLKTTRAGVSYTENGNEITVTAGGWSGWIFATGLLAVGDYYIHFNCNDSNFRGAAFVTDENLIVTRANMTYGGGADGNTKITLTEPSRIALFVACGSSGSATITNLQVELGEAYTEWKPYNPSSRSISISLGSTVYGGTVDVVTGVGEVTHKMVTLVGGEPESWSNYNATYGGYRLTLSDAKIDGLPIDQLKSNLFAPNNHRGVMAEWKPYYLATYNNKTDSTMVFFTTSLTDKSEWLAWLAANPTQLSYPLATPIPIQLTPQEVESLAGDNTMWSDANQPITVEYRSN